MKEKFWPIFIIILLFTSLILLIPGKYLESQVTNLRATNITAFGASSQLNVQTALTNAVIGQLTAVAGNVTLASTKSGSAGYQPLLFQTNGSTQYQIDTSGNLATSGGTIIIANTGALTGLKFASQTNCSSSSGVCGSAPSGGITIAAAATTVTVATTAVTANSNINISEDSTMGTRLSVTCNTTLGRTYAVTTKTASTSFVITASAAPTTNPACLVYTIFN